MGGLWMSGAGVVAALAVDVWTEGAPPDLLIAVAGTGLFAVIGGVDDALAIARRRNLGLRAREKLLLQIPAALLLGAYVAWVLHADTGLAIPGTRLSVDLGWAYPVFCAALIVGMVNAVNLTDGLDGDRKSIRLNSSHEWISYAVFCLKKKKKKNAIKKTIKINNTSTQLSNKCISH